MRKMSTFILKLLTLLLVLSISLCSCEQINAMLGGNGSNDDVSDNVTTETPEGSEDEKPDISDNVTNDEKDEVVDDKNDEVTDDKNDDTTDDNNDDTTDDNKDDTTGDSNEHVHSYASNVTAPTCLSQGYTTFKCECGTSYISEVTAALGHSFANGECTVCGIADPDYKEPTVDSFDYSLVPEYSNSNYVAINGNVPYFTKDEITSVSFESYSDLDALGRVGTAFACLGKETLPTSDRGSLSYNPTGWVQKNYPTNIVSTTQIYNRSHLIAWSLAGENNNEKNLMTGTPYFNQIGMQIFENQVLDYIKETGNHVMYRITPVFVGDNLLANGVLMEGWSVEDNGEGICFCVFMYNVQPGIIIEYETGNNYLPASENDKSYSATLVTDLSQIKAGDQIIIVAKNANYALGNVSDSGNNRVAAEIEKDGNTVYFGDDVTIITLGNGKSAGTYSFSVSGGYLYSASSSKTYLKTESALSDNSSWSISISTNGVATVKSTGSFTRNWLRFNSSNIIFASYGSGQQDICIYIVNS